MRRRSVLAVVGISFCAGALVAASLSQRVSRESWTKSQTTGTTGRDNRVPVPTTGRAPVESGSTPGPSNGAGRASVSTDLIGALRRRSLAVPIDGADPGRWKGEFYEEREGRRHEAVDVLAPRNTPIRAVDDGVIAKLFNSRAGGLTIYQRDPTNRFIYYYAHLERYADVHEGEDVTRGDVIGFVGTSGNAPADTPHLHFAIFIVDDPAKWWVGTPVDPYEVYAGK